MVRERTKVDRPRTEARQDSRVERLSRRRRLSGHSVRRLAAAAGPLRDYARLRHAIAARGRAPDDRDHRPSPEPGSDRSGHGSSTARLHHHPAARRDRAAGRHGHALHAGFRRHLRHRSLLPGRVGRPARPVRRRDFSWQGDLRPSRLPDHLRQPLPARESAESRSDRRHSRRGGAGDGNRTV